MRNKAIVFISDEPFLIPTLNASLQIAAQPSVTEQADIVIYITKIDHDLVERLRECLAATPIQLRRLDPSSYDLPPGTIFNPTHVPVTTLARLSMGAAISEQYDHVIYLDGDIHIIGDLLPLVSYEVAPGRIAAASEAAWIYQGELGRYWPFMQSYMANLGIDNPSDYFNAGVLLFRRDTWLEYAPKVKQFFFENSDRCLYHDQSALNAVFLGRRDVLSPRWNFVSGYATNATVDIDELRILHFTGGDKPWNSLSPPWNGRFREGYLDLVERFPILQPLGSYVALRDPAVARRQKGQRGRPYLPWRPIMRNRRIQRYMQDATFALP